TPTAKTKAKSPIRYSGFVSKLRLRAFWVKLEKVGKNRYTKTMAIPRATKAMINDSPINCLTRLRRSAPIALRSPTSIDRKEERAVERFIKLMQAINSINN